VRRHNRGITFFAGIAVTAVAVLTAGCSSAASASGVAAAPKTKTTTASSDPMPGQATLKCLASYGISKATLRELYFGSTTAMAGISQAKLKLAGQDCWQKTGTGLLSTAFKRIDTCLGVEGVATPNAGTPLADVLLELETRSQKVRSALQFCLRT
jgi:hypothetical protein